MSRKGWLVVTVLLFAASFDIHAIEVGSIADSRFEDSGGWTLDGEEMTDTRAKLLNPANFGPAGTVSDAVHITDLAGPISYTDLSNLDIFLVGYFEDDDPDFISEDEGTAMIAWVEAGGTMIISCDDNAHDAICIAFGVGISGSSATPPANPTVVGATRPMFDGPFGTPSELAMAGERQYFSNTGGYSVLAQDQDGHPVILEALIGNGRVIALSDIDMISNDTLSDGGGIENDNDEFLANLIAYLASEAGETFFLNAGVNGNWWGGPERSGEGAQVEVIITGEVLSVFLTFYSYDPEGNQIFLVAIGTVNGNTAEVTVYITEGGEWGDDFNPDTVNETVFGTGEFSATNCGAAHLVVTPNAEYEVLGYTPLEYDLERLAPPAAPCPIPWPD